MFPMRGIKRDVIEMNFAVSDLRRTPDTKRAAYIFLSRLLLQSKIEVAVIGDKKLAHFAEVPLGA